jgi:hypothetical protein
MPLVEIWKKSPEQLRGKTIQQVLVFAGDGRLKDGNSTSAEFREFLAHVPSEDLSTFASQCLETSFQDSGLALQDIANQVGKRLGFTVEDGRYRGTTTAVGFDGLWRAKGGEVILVEVKTTDAYRLSLDTAANYRKQLVRDGTIIEEKSSILYIVGRADTGDLEAQVRGSRFAWNIRLISVDALLRLLRIKEELEDQQTVDRIRAILMPQEYTRVDGIIDLVFKATEEVRTDAPLVEPEAETAGGEKQPKFTPVTFRPACIERIQKFLKETLVRQSAATFATPDGKAAVLSATSRSYGKGNRTSYWFAFHPYQKETLAAYKTAWVTFGCGSEENILMVPFNEFATWLPRFHETHLADRSYWHVRVRREHDKWQLAVKRGEQSIDVTKFLLR